MKETFYKLDEEKRRRVEDAALEEFGQYGYERGSTDRIIRASGISKGGLYEYIESKEDLFLHIVSRAFGALYDHIISRLRSNGKASSEPLPLLRAASEAALDFYLENPAVVRLIASLSSIADPDARARSEAISRERFTGLFTEADFTRVRFGREEIIDLLMWMLVKTRSDFIAELQTPDDRERIRAAYLADWDFILSVLADGIYRKRGS
jgi:AcrR family transcriptional regulator